MKKFKSFMGKLKKYILIYIVVWIVLAILLVAPATYTVTEGNLAGINWLQAIIYNFVDNLFKFPITRVWEETYINDFIKGMEYYSLAYIIIVFMAIWKSLPKGDFHDIEHGSSDWCEQGEQYTVLNKKNGLILAKDNYLPIDKPGNVNVLIVGRIWCW